MLLEIFRRFQDHFFSLSVKSTSMAQKKIQEYRETVEVFGVE